MLLKTVPVLIFFSFTTAQSDTVRQTEYGRVRGELLRSRANSTIQYLSFKGVQYAAPPLGKLRFKEPQPPKPWRNTKCTTKHKDVCMQFDPVTGENVIGSEDCLYLDVYIPITAAITEPMPVLVWFHGGNWVSTSTNDTGPDYLMEKPVVVVEVESRLNVFGFFTTLDDNAKGNCGLKDQVLALEWIQDNIEYFDGDPSRVTLSGSGNGGISVLYHMMSPLSEGLFSGGITQSGSPLNGWAFQRHPLEKTQKLLQALKIDSTDNADIVEQLQGMDAETLFTTALDFSVVGFYTPYDSQPFAPIIEVESDTSFLCESPYDLLQSGRYSKVPLIVGFNSQEAERCWTFIESGRVDLNSYQQNPEMFIPESMNIPDDSSCIGTTVSNITMQYFPDGNYTNPYEWIPYMSMDLFILGILEATYFMQNDISIYFYYFSYVGSRNAAFLRPRGVAHHEEEYYLWYPQGYGANPNETAQDKLTRERMVTLWTNFAAERNPTPEEDELLQSVMWPPKITSDQCYLDFNSTLEVKTPIPNEPQMPFWVELYAECGFSDPNPNEGSVETVVG